MKQAPSDRPAARGLRTVVIRSAFNANVVEGLTAGAIAALTEMGARSSDLTMVDVPGAFELPLAAQAAAVSGRFDAIVALGAVIQGETDHYQHIAREAAAGLAAVARETGVAVGFGVLTCADEEQALRRSSPGEGNKGAEAARAAVAMVHVLRRMQRTGRGRRPTAGVTARRNGTVSSRRSGSRRLTG